MKIAFYPFFEREKKMKKIQFSDLIDNRFSYSLYMVQDGEDNSAQRKRRMAAIKQIISELKPDYQKLIRLYYFDGLNMREIAEMENKDKSVICRKLQRAKEKIRIQVRFL